MQTTILGRTNLTVSRMGLGAGGHSRLGRNTAMVKLSKIIQSINHTQVV